MKKFKKVVIIIIVFIIFILGLIYWAFFDMDRLPKGELISSTDSPNQQYTINIYRTNGGATVSYAVRGEVEFNNVRRKPRNIYWQYREEEADVTWIDEETVIINNRTLNVLKDRYDYRNK